mgnify:CR=1 FL=1
MADHHVVARLAAAGDTLYVTLGFTEPVVALDGKTGQTLLRYGGTEHTSTILVKDDTLYLAKNVLGEIPGSDLGHELVMIGAHFDTWHASPNASDNTSGCAVAIEAARILKAVGASLVEIHGQNEHLRLVRGAEQFRLLDAAGDFAAELERNRECFFHWQTLEQEKQGLLRTTPLDAAESDLVRYQVEELEQDRTYVF